MLEESRVLTLKHQGDLDEYEHVGDGMQVGNPVINVALAIEPEKVEGDGGSAEHGWIADDSIDSKPTEPVRCDQRQDRSSHDQHRRIRRTLPQADQVCR